MHRLWLALMLTRICIWGEPELSHSAPHWKGTITIVYRLAFSWGPFLQAEIASPSRWWLNGTTVFPDIGTYLPF